MIKTRREAETPRSKSEEPMYKRKELKDYQSSFLHEKFLMISNSKQIQKSYYSSNSNRREGRRAINIALEYMRQNIYSTQAADLNVCGP